jgi:antitoxin (DNA-binding transcriptional repressor) of toxin-antitoxin stability system
MAPKSMPVDVRTMPDVARLAHEVAESGQRRVLTENGVAVAVISPARSRRRRRARPLTAEDSLWSIVGIIKDEVPADVSANKHKYLAEAYLPDER